LRRWFSTGCGKLGDYPSLHPHYSPHGLTFLSDRLQPSGPQTKELLNNIIRKLPTIIPTMKITDPPVSIKVGLPTVRIVSNLEVPSDTLGAAFCADCNGNAGDGSFFVGSIIVLNTGLQRL